MSKKKPLSKKDKPIELVSPAPKPGLLATLRRNFLTGVVVAAPIGITIFLTWTFIEFVDSKVTPLIPKQYNPEEYLQFSIPGLGVLVVVASLTLLGALTANLFGRTILDLGERFVDRMPVVRSIYATLKQIFETAVSQSENSFKEVGLIEYPRPGLYAICFVTTNTKGEIKSLVGEEMVSVFLPTTPNPTSGYLLFVPRADIQILDMTVEEGAKLVISAGIVEPDYPRTGASKERIEKALAQWKKPKAVKPADVEADGESLENERALP